MPLTSKKVTKRKVKGVSRKGGNTCPIFLQKSYLMIDTCDPEIASWSEDKETSFVVKNPDRFASEIIPQFFKHSNFASFVRQLNFYGFRKIKSDPIKLIDAAQQKEAKYWYFRHDLFVKGRKDLLNEIRKANQVPVQDQEDVSSLKIEVSSLQEKISQMNSGIEKLSTFIESAEKPKYNDLPSHPQITSFDADESASDLLDFSNVSDMDLLVEDRLSSSSNMDENMEYEKQDVLTPLPNFSSTSQDQSSSLLCAVSSDTELEDSLLFTDLENDAVALGVTTDNLEKSTMVEGGSSTGESDSDFRQPLYDCLAVLPKSAQEEIVNGLAETIASPDFFNDHINAISSLANMMAELVANEKTPDGKNVDMKDVLPQMSTSPQHSTPLTPSDNEQEQHSDLTLKLVSAVMASFLSQPKSTIACHDHAQNTNHTSVPIQV